MITDPGDQERGRPKKVPQYTPPAKEPDLWETPAQPPREKGEGEQRKEKALKRHEESSRAPLIRFLRTRLMFLYKERAFDQRHNPSADIFVTADDAVRILKDRNIVPTDDDGEDEPRNWLGALFKNPGWRYTGRSVPSLRKELNGRHVRCWRWEGA